MFNYKKQLSEIINSTHFRNKMQVDGLMLSRNYQLDGFNHGVAVYGDPGRAVSNYVIPNIEKMINNGHSFVITDPRGRIRDRLQYTLEQNGYNVQTLDLSTKDYDPLRHIRQEDLIPGVSINFVEWFMYNNGYTYITRYHPFSESAVDVSFHILDAVIRHVMSSEMDKSIISVIDVLSRGADNLDRFYQKAETEKTGDWTRAYHNVRNMISKNMLDVVLSGLVNKLGHYSVSESADADFQALRQSKNALFIIPSAFHEERDKRISGIISQIYEELAGSKNVLHFFLNDFADIGVIPHFYDKVRNQCYANKGHSIIAQEPSQIRNLYIWGEWDETNLKVISSCYILYFGHHNIHTMEYISKRSGKLFRKPLLNVDEIRNLEDDECIIIPAEYVTAEKRPLIDNILFQS